jgi:hypothetical protein
MQVDASKDIVSWVREKGYGLLDVNILLRSPTAWTVSSKPHCAVFDSHAPVSQVIASSPGSL